MRFYFTDGRPWYKQILSGIFYSVYYMFWGSIILTAMIALYYRVPEMTGLNWWEIFVGFVLVITGLVILEWCME